MWEVKGGKGEEKETKGGSQWPTRPMSGAKAKIAWAEDDDPWGFKPEGHNRIREKKKNTNLIEGESGLR